MENVNTISESLRYFDAKKKIGILGGTFNPPHLGHLYIAEQAWREFSLDKVLVLPVGDPPHKKNANVLDKDIRLAMAELFAKERPYLKVCTLEMDREGYTYTVDTLTAIDQHVYGAELFYLIGTDTLYELVTWKNFQKVFAMIAFICIMRPGDSREDAEEKISQLSRDYGAVIHLSKGFAPDISSTEIRRRFAEGKSVKQFVPKSINEFMEKNHVFR